MNAAYTVFNALAGSSTTVYRGKVFNCNAAVLAIMTAVFEKTGTGTGSIHLEVNNKPDQAYLDDVNAAAGATFELKEAANTAGWDQRDLVPTAAIAVTAANPERHNVETDDFGFRRGRFVYTNATGTVVLSGWVNLR